MTDLRIETATVVREVQPDNERLSIRDFNNFEYTPNAAYELVDSDQAFNSFGGGPVDVVLDVAEMNAGNIIFCMVAWTANASPPYPTIAGSVTTGNGSLTLIGERETESNGDIAKVAFYYYTVSASDSGSVELRFFESSDTGELAAYAAALRLLNAPDAFEIGPAQSYNLGDVQTPAVPGTFADAVVIRAALMHDGSSWSQSAGYDELVDTWVSAAGRRQQFTLQIAEEITSDPVGALTLFSFGSTDIGFGATFVFNNQTPPEVSFPPPDNATTSAAFFEPTVDPSPVCAVRLTAPSSDTWIAHTIEARIAIDTQAPEDQVSVWRLYFEDNEADLSPNSPYVEAVVQHFAGDIEGTLRPRFARFRIPTANYFADGDASMNNVNLHFVLECRTTDPRHTVPTNQRLGVRDNHCKAIVFGVTAPLNSSPPQGG